MTTLARTGIDEHLPLASAGGFLALGGAAIIFGAPRRRRPARRSI
ncbi:MAG: LPXTG cell wall anchor domain-containing protein [Acidimicrobiia bacterium]